MEILGDLWMDFLKIECKIVYIYVFLWKSFIVFSRFLKVFVFYRLGIVEIMMNKVKRVCF